MLPADGLRDGYNEVIFDAEVWVQHLPRTIQAFFVKVGGPQPEAVSVRNAFIGEHRLGPDEVPVLVYNPRDGDAAFRRIS